MPLGGLAKAFSKRCVPAVRRKTEWSAVGMQRGVGRLGSGCPGGDDSPPGSTKCIKSVRVHPAASVFRHVVLPRGPREAPQGKFWGTGKEPARSSIERDGCENVPKFIFQSLLGAHCSNEVSECSNDSA